MVVGQTPPPIGGQAVMIQALLDGTYDDFDLVHVRMDFSHHVDEIGAFRLRKLGHLVQTIVRVALARFRDRCTILYFPPAGPNIVPICRDIAILLCTRWMFRAVIFHFHASGVSDAIPRLPAPLRPLCRMAYSKPDVAVRLSDLTPDDPGALGARTTFVVPNGVADHAGDRAPARPRQPPGLLYVGVLSQSKGVLVLLEACAILKKHGVPFRLDLVGGPQPASFGVVLTERIDELGIGDHVNLRGVLWGDEKWQVFGEAAVFCFPTSFESEAFPVVLLEAMQFGMPVVATRWRGIPSIVEDGHTGFLVAPGDATATANRIETLLRDPDLAAGMGANGRERYLSRFTIDVFQRNMAAAIESVAR